MDNIIKIKPTLINNITEVLTQIEVDKEVLKCGGKEKEWADVVNQIMVIGQGKRMNI